MRGSAGFPGGVNWLLTKMVTCCTTTRRNDYSSIQQYFEVAFSVFIPLLSLDLPFSLLH